MPKNSVAHTALVVFHSVQFLLWKHDVRSEKNLHNLRLEFLKERPCSREQLRSNLFSVDGGCGLTQPLSHHAS